MRIRERATAGHNGRCFESRGTSETTLLRQRMLDDMALHNMSPATQCVYINTVKNFMNGKAFKPEQEKILRGSGCPKTIPIPLYALLRPVQKMASQGCGQGGNSGQPFRPKFAHIVRVLGGSYPLRAIPSVQQIPVSAGCWRP